MDRFEYCDIDLNLEERIGVIAELCARGYGKQLLLPHDLGTYCAVFGSWEQYRAEQLPAADFTFIHNQVAPASSHARHRPDLRPHPAGHTQRSADGAGRT